MPLKKAYLIILASFAWLIGGAVLFDLIGAAPDSTFADIYMPILLVVFVIIFLIGTATWSEAKGHGKTTGVILGWLGPLGLLILVFLSDKSGRS